MKFRLTLIFTHYNIRVIHTQKRPLKRDLFFLAPRVGFEPTANALTAHCSTTELPRNIRLSVTVYTKNQ